LDYSNGYERGWTEACDFIDRHPHGMPWSALPDHEEPEPDDDYERGKRNGWLDRMREEGWPTSRRGETDE
jgi:hypothetical protein